MTVQEKIPFLYKVAYNYTSQRSTAEELVQETIYKALKYSSKFKQGTNLNAWLATILRNTFINQYRKKSKYFCTDNISAFIGGRDQYKVKNNSESNMQLDYIHGVIAKLPESLRNPLMLHLEGHSYDEIAKMSNIALGTVKSRIHHARKRLKVDLSHLRAA